MRYFKHIACILLIISFNDIVAMKFDSDSDDEESLEGGECFGGFGGYKIEQIMADDHISMDSIKTIDLDDESSSLIKSKLLNYEDYTTDEIKKIEKSIGVYQTDCLLAFKALQTHLAIAEHKAYDREKIRSFFDIHKKAIAEFKKTDAGIDFITEINSIIATHHSL